MQIKKEKVSDIRDASALFFISVEHAHHSDPTWPNSGFKHPHEESKYSEASEVLRGCAQRDHDSP